MQSFSNYLGGLRLEKLATEAFTLLAERGIDPMLFVEWYEEEGQFLSEQDANPPAANQPASSGVSVPPGYTPPKNQGFFSQAKSWLRGGNLAAYTKDNVKAAVQALQAIQQRSWMMQGNPELEKSLGELLKLLSKGDIAKPTSDWRVNQPATGATPTNAPGAPVARADPSWQNPTPQVAWNSPSGKLIRETASQLSKVGIDPNQFIHWYITEGQYYEDEILFEDRIGDWFKAVWHGATGAQGFGQNYQTYYDDLKKKSAYDAVQSLKTIQNNSPFIVQDNPQVKHHMDIVLRHLEDMMNEKPKEGGAEEGGAQQGGAEQPQQQTPDWVGDQSLYKGASGQPGQPTQAPANSDTSQKVKTTHQDVIDALQNQPEDHPKLKEMKKRVNVEVEKLRQAGELDKLRQAGDANPDLAIWGKAMKIVGDTITQKAQQERETGNASGPANDELRIINLIHNDPENKIGKALGEAASLKLGRFFMEWEYKSRLKFVPRSKKVFAEWHYLAGIKK